MNKWILLGVVMLGYWSSAPSNASSLTVTSLVESIRQHHPRIKEAAARRAQREQERDIALSAFDSTFEQTSAFRLSGFFDGQYLNQQVRKRIKPFGAQVYTGYRISEGEFPVYEGDTVTLSGGEARVGVAFSLLNGRKIDPFRTALQNAELSAAIGLTNEAQALNSILYEGISVFLQWRQASLRYEEVKSLVETTRSRFVGIQSRVESGDLARISLTEFQATLLGRERILQQALQEKILAKHALAFYWRDHAGNMIELDNEQQPAPQMRWPFGLSPINLAIIQTNIQQHPQLKTLRLQQRQATNDVILKQNQLLPKLDVEFEVSNDVGRGSSTLVGTENKLGLQLSIPLGQRKAKAARQQAQHRVSELNYAIGNVVDTLHRDLKMALDDVKYERQIIELNTQQVSVAKQLVAQEVVRFESGTSDLFLLNSRETQSIEASLNLITNQTLLYQKELAVWGVSGVLGRFDLCCTNFVQSEAFDRATFDQ